MHKTLQRLSMIFFIPFTVLSLLILGASFFTTIYYDLDQGADLPRYASQNYFLLIPGVILFFLAAYFAGRMKNYS